VKYITIPLQGTDRQVQWASAIRSKKLRAIEAIERQFRSLPDIQYRIAWLHTIPHAHWWIVRRNSPVYALVSELQMNPIWPKRYTLSTSQDVLEWAHSIFNTVIIDTETTGLDEASEIVEIAVIGLDGQVLLNTLVKPTIPIPSDAMAIHHITDAMVTQSPTFHEVWPFLRAILCQNRVVIYNASYDMKIIRALAAKETLPCPPVYADCAMHAYATFKQEINPVTGDFKWYKLEVAANALGLTVPAHSHRALADCVTTLGIIDSLKQEYDRQFERVYE
jgi:DNA polymerase-3 subunit epsilon